MASIAETTRPNGQRLIDNFLRKFPALDALRKEVEHRARTVGYLIGLDGRILPTRSPRTALSSLLQGFESAVVKRATWIAHQNLLAQGFVYGKDFAMVGWFHDEMQFTCRPDLGDVVGKTAVAAIEQAGREFKTECPLTGAYRVGPNWAATH